MRDGIGSACAQISKQNCEQQVRDVNAEYRAPDIV